MIRIILILALGVISSGTTMAASPGSAAFDLVPGVLIAPSSGLVYVMRDEGRTQAIRASSGLVQWSSDAIAKPLAIFNGELIGQAAGLSNNLVLFRTDALNGGKANQAALIALPAGVEAMIGDTLRKRFSSTAVVRDGQLLISWEESSRYGKAIAPGTEQANVVSASARSASNPGAEPTQTTKSGAFRLDAGFGRAIGVDLTDLSSSLNLPASVQDRLDDQARQLPVFKIGDVLALTQPDSVRGASSISLYRWDAVSGSPLETLELATGELILQLPSSDGQHVLVSTRAAPGDAKPYLWSIYSLFDGKLVMTLRHRRSHAHFAILDDTLLYIIESFGQLHDGEMKEIPRQLAAVSVSDGSDKWQISIRDTAFRGLMPP